MAEIEITLPTVQYGNIKITATPEEWGLETIADAPDVGVWAATYLNLFQQGFKHGATLDVDAHLGGSKPVTEEQAIRHLDEGLGGVTAVAGDQPEDDLGFPVGESDKPWDKPAEAAKKPWETDQVTAPAVLDAIGEGW